jgi:hypothetical protein
MKNKAIEKWIVDHGCDCESYKLCIFCIIQTEINTLETQIGKPCDHEFYQGGGKLNHLIYCRKWGESKEVSCRNNW